jgi:hypothetical protein
MALSEPIEGIILYPACCLTERISVVFTHLFASLIPVPLRPDPKVNAITDGQGTLGFISDNSQVLPM